MPLSRVRQIVEGPARVAGLKVEDALVGAATRDAGTEDAPCPPRLSRCASCTTGTRPEARAKPAARIDSSFSRTTCSPPIPRRDSTPGELRPAAGGRGHPRGRRDDLQALRNCFVEALVRVNSEGEYVRHPARWEQLPDRARPLLERLAAARLLVFGEAGGERTVEVAHEALLRKWPRLTAWLDQKREFLVGKAQLERALADWQRAPDADKPEALLQGLFRAAPRSGWSSTRAP
jgi:hypothetical protein